MAVLILLLIVFAAGMVGGTINALISDNGFALPTRVDAGDGVKVLRPGWLGNALIGGVGAAVSWSLYGPLAGVSIVATHTTAAENGGATTPAGGDLTLAAIGGAILVGVAGARWLSNEVDKTLLRAAGAQSAKRQHQDALVAAFAAGTPADALQAAHVNVESPGPELERQ